MWVLVPSIYLKSIFLLAYLQICLRISLVGSGPKPTTLVLHTNALCNLHGTVYVSGLLSGERTEVTVHKDRSYCTYFLRPVISLIKSPCRFRSGGRHICLFDQVMRYIVGLLFSVIQ